MMMRKSVRDAVLLVFNLSPFLSYSKRSPSRSFAGKQASKQASKPPSVCQHRCVRPRRPFFAARLPALAVRSLGLVLRMDVAAYQQMIYLSRRGHRK
mmetsp:Transcript_6695/g.11736  ORF Transcript_6695/g.11736 Transcript_6695/m.11736 type:complete len:97 (-) Transcript_6695:1009-1299(-)